MPDGHGRQSTKGMPLAVRMLVLLERAKWFEGSTPGTDNSKAQVVSDGACVSHLCRPTHSNSHPHSECERVEFHRNLRATSTERPFFRPSAPTDDDDGEAALHFLALPWAEPVEGSARGA